MKELLAYVADENRWAAHNIHRQFNRLPMDGELMDLGTANGRAKIRQHLEFNLEDEVLHQDGERPLREAQADYRRLTKILGQLGNYQQNVGVKSGGKRK